MIQWRKSSRSANSGQADCVELARLLRTVNVRDSKAPEVGYLSFSPESFSELVARIKQDELDL